MAINSNDIDEMDEYSNSIDDPVFNTPSKSTGGNKYNINLYKYPSDLGSEDVSHYIEFQINVRGKSEFNKNNRIHEIKRNPDAANFTDEQLATATTNSVRIAGAVAGFAIAKSLLSKISRSGRPAPTTTAGKSADTVIAAGVGVGTGLAAGAAINASSLLKPDTTYRISDVINLYVDNPPTVRYGMNYANKDLGTLAGLLSGSAFDSQGAFQGTGESLAAFGTTMAKLPGALGATDVQSLLSASSKTSLNPFKEVMFESVDFRKFAFKYKFFPKSPSETREIKDIIKLFKFHMHPELSAGKLFFIYPAEFQITYYYKNSENNFFHKFAPCVLESMEVSYGGDQFSSFKDGSPTEINMSLTFSETEILTKKMIEKDY